MKRLLVILAFGISTVCHVLAAEGPASFSVSEFKFQRPAGWEWVETRSPMRKAQLKALDHQEKGAAEVVFFHFGPGDGGGVKGNVDRWFGQFQEPREKLGAKSEEKTIGKHKVTFVHAQGTYENRMAGDGKGPQANTALHGAIIESEAGSVFIKMTGPAALVKSVEKDFLKMVESALK